MRLGLVPMALLVTQLLLSGCNDEPGNGEMRRLVEEHTRRSLGAQGVRGFDGFEAFRKQGCVDTKDRPGYYDCYYNATFAATQARPRVTVNGKGRFHRGAHGLEFEVLGAMRDDRELLAVIVTPAPRASGG